MVSRICRESRAFLLTHMPQMPYLREMPDLSLKALDESLMRAVKKAAIDQDLSLRDFVIKALATAVGWEAFAAMPEMAGMPKKSRKTPKNALIESGELGRVAGVEIEEESGASFSIPPTYDRPAHDPKTCHINKCFMCAAVK